MTEKSKTTSGRSGGRAQRLIKRSAKPVINPEDCISANQDELNLFLC